MKEKSKLEVCFSPALFEYYKDTEAIVVVVDILRATTAISAAFMNGVDKIIPVGTIDEAREYKNSGYMVAAERDGIVKDFADFGNSPFNFTPERVSGKTIVYSTTNGTNSVMMSKDAYRVVIGSYLNVTALSNWLVKQEKPVLILCAAWKNKFNLEDSVFAGCLSEKLLASGVFYTICDSVKASIDLWEVAEPNLYSYILKAAQKERLRKNGLDDVIEYCHTKDLTIIVPVLEKNYLKRLQVNAGKPLIDS